jgi:murein DD-endopeptidase MepM/ murein hydrolase activator NlpD
MSGATTFNTLVKIALVLTLFQLFGCALHQSSRPQSAAKYVVKKGETLAQIANRHGHSLHELIELNDLEDPDFLEIGQLLYLPVPQRPRPSAAFFQTAKEAGVTPLNPLSRSEVQKIVGPLVWPVEAGKLSSPFGQRTGSFHEGLDIRAKEGSEVVAAHAGKVAYVGNEWQGYGNMIVVLGRGFCTVYAHNNRNLVDEGDIVEAGQQIATVGMTGTASGPHLHFEVRVDRENGFKSAVDPLALRIKNPPQIMARNTKR